MRRVLALIAALLLSTTYALATTDSSASLTIHIEDSAGKPLWLARATIYGPKVLAAVSDRAGDAEIPNIPGADYRLRVEHYGYATVDIAQVAIDPGQSLVVTVRMIKTGLKQIATVTAKIKPKANVSSVKESDTQAQLSDSLIAALQSLPGVSVGPNGEASIRGYAANQTTIAINGVPVSAPGSAQSLALFGASAFSSASVLPSAGGGGTVNFTTRSPSLAWQGVARAVMASNHGEDLAFQESGTTGFLGVSYTHARNVASDPLDGKSFLDSSGLYYSHDASAAVDGDALQLRYEFSQDNTILATAVALDSSIPLVCRQWTGEVPCGYGPTNVQRNLLQSFQIKDSAQFGQSVADVTVYANHSANDLDQSGYYVNGVNEPSQSLSDTHQTGAIASVHLQLGNNAILPLSLSTSSTRTRPTGSAFGPLLPNVLARYTSESAATSLPLIGSQFSRFSITGDVGLQSNAVDGERTTRMSGALTANDELTKRDSLSARFSPGNLGDPTAGFSGISPAAQLQFVCDAGIGVGVGPSSPSSKATQTTMNLSWGHQADHWGTQVSYYHNVQFNAPIAATVNAAGLDPTLFGPNYLQQAASAERAVCGPSAAPTFDDLYYHVSGVADRAVYSGLNLAVSVGLGSRTGLGLSYTSTTARAYGNDPLLFGEHSTVIAGRQLPNVAPSQASASINTAIGSRVIGLIAANYESANNSGNLPAYTTFDAGILAQMSRGLLSVTVTNLGNAYPGPFASSAGAVALPMTDGAFPTIAQPLAPRTIRVGYRFNIGPPERTITFGIPNEQFQRPIGMFLVHLGGSAALEAGAPRDPFAIDRQSINCGPRDVAPAQALLDAWKGYVAAIERARANGAYPTTYPPLVRGAVQYNYHSYGASYVILITPAPGMLADFKRQFQPVESCAWVRAGNRQQIAALGLFDFPPRYRVDATDLIDVMLPRYAPSVGLYQTRSFDAKIAPSGPQTPNLPEAQNLLLHGFPPVEPKGQPFALKSWTYCSSELEPAAQELLDALKSYVHAYYDSHQKLADPQGLLIVPHTEAAGKTWLEIRTEDLSVIRPLSQCMFVKTYFSADLQRMGLGGADQPELNYAPSIGLYQVL